MAKTASGTCPALPSNGTRPRSSDGRATHLKERSACAEMHKVEPPYMLEHP